MNISIKTIPHQNQRYDTSGDWWFKNDNLEIRCSNLKNWKYEFLIAIHELCEAVLCQDRGIDQELVDNFDFVSLDDEPGLNPKSPYHKEHMIADIVERIMCQELNVEWEEYEQAISLYN